MQNSRPLDGSPPKIVTPDELKAWKAGVAAARERAERLGLLPEFEESFRLHRRLTIPPDAAALALKEVTELSVSSTDCCIDTTSANSAPRLEKVLKTA